jgi:hypothetical protein
VICSIGPGAEAEAGETREPRRLSRRVASVHDAVVVSVSRTVRRGECDSGTAVSSQASAGNRFHGTFIY